MAQTACVIINTEERERLATIVADRNRPRKHVHRARIVLAAADRGSAQLVARSTGVSRPMAASLPLDLEGKRAALINLSKAGVGSNFSGPGAGGPRSYSARVPRGTVLRVARRAAACRASRNR